MSTPPARASRTPARARAAIAFFCAALVGSGSLEIHSRHEHAGGAIPGEEMLSRQAVHPNQSHHIESNSGEDRQAPCTACLSQLHGFGAPTARLAVRRPPAGAMPERPAPRQIASGRPNGATRGRAPPLPSF